MEGGSYVKFRKAVQSSPSARKIPTANQARFAAFRIKSIGLVQGDGGVGESLSLILKSPLAESITPAVDVLNWVKGVVAEQIRVAITDVPGGGRPALFPPAKIRPFPSTLMLPFALTLASSLSITQIWPGGDTPRTTFGFTVTGGPVTQAAGAAGQPATDETGMTPMPPLNLMLPSSATAELGETVCKTNVQTIAPTVNKHYFAE